MELNNITYLSGKGPGSRTPNTSKEIEIFDSKLVGTEPLAFEASNEEEVIVSRHLKIAFQNNKSGTGPSTRGLTRRATPQNESQNAGQEQGIDEIIAAKFAGKVSMGT